MGNVSIPQSLTDALTALKLDALKTAMNAINAKLKLPEVLVVVKAMVDRVVLGRSGSSHYSG